MLKTNPFGEGKVMYTIKNIVTENPDIVYNDDIECKRKWKWQ